MEGREKTKSFPSVDNGVSYSQYTPVAAQAVPDTQNDIATFK